MRCLVKRVASWTGEGKYLSTLPTGDGVVQLVLRTELTVPYRCASLQSAWVVSIRFYSL
jgi:hypothetical protein